MSKLPGKYPKEFRIEAMQLTTKTCTACKQEKPDSNFRALKCSLAASCKMCQSKARSERKKTQKAREDVPKPAQKYKSMLDLPTYVPVVIAPARVGADAHLRIKSKGV